MNNIVKSSYGCKNEPKAQTVLMLLQSRDGRREGPFQEQDYLKSLWKIDMNNYSSNVIQNVPFIPQEVQGH